MTADDLQTADFDQFFAALHRAGEGKGLQPFPWQRRLVQLVAADGRWPGLLDLPTGSGKTAVIDAALFLMALRADAPRRVVFVVDRRVVVSQAARRAREIAQRLADSTDRVVREVARRLRALAPFHAAPDSLPVRVAELRGGIVRDETWAWRPDTPTVVVSTVDQVGSRLAFRGYGLSQGMRPIHAGLLGNDCLYFLDEVHLARPFAATLRSLGERYRPPRDSGLPERWQVVELSATPGRDKTPRRVLRLDDADVDEILSPILARRVNAHKPISTRLVKAGKEPTARRHHVAERCVDEARRLLGADDVSAVGVVVNRVATAQAIARRLVDTSGADTVLVTGRMRPFDRERLLDDVEGRLATGARERSAPTRPVVIVATQTIEAGADLDLDAMVTECASLDALRQRLGRVDRDGWHGARGRPAETVVVASEADVVADADDPVYRRSLPATWDWLQEAGRDFGIAHFPEVAPDALEALLAPHGEAPYLLASHLDRWVQTSPPPEADPPVEPFLHGFSEPDVDVTLIWRADLTGELLADRDGADLASSLLAACPPGAGEAMQVPLHAVRSWLADLVTGETTEAAVADVEGTAAPTDTEPGRRQGQKRPAAIKPALRWTGDDSTVALMAHQLRPGDTLVVPSSYGGIANGSWDPEASDPVSDLGHRVQMEQRQRPTLRLVPGLLADAPEVPLPADVEDERLDDEVVGQWLADFVTQVDNGMFPRNLESDAARHLTSRSRRVIERVPVHLCAPSGVELFEVYVVSLRGRLPAPSSDTVDTEPETSSFIGAAVTLLQHSSDVEAWAAALAAGCGLPPTLVDDLGLAGAWHDLGKADARFQIMLRDARVVADTGEPAEPLAKSLVPAGTRYERERARRAAGYPKSARHEQMSLALLGSDPTIEEQAHDWDLVAHLVVSHHGCGRPFVPFVLDPSPVTVTVSASRVGLLSAGSDHCIARLDSGVPERFWTLIGRYGWYGLAWLEAVLRLADHRASAACQTSGAGEG